MPALLINGTRKFEAILIKGTYYRNINEGTVFIHQGQTYYISHDTKTCGKKTWLKERGFFVFFNFNYLIPNFLHVIFICN